MSWKETPATGCHRSDSKICETMCLPYPKTRVSSPPSRSGPSPATVRDAATLVATGSEGKPELAVYSADTEQPGLLRRVRPQIGDSLTGFDEPVRFSCQREPRLFRIRDRDPLFHDATIATRVECDARVGLDQLVDTRLRE